MPKRIAELDGLRGLAIALVLLYHFWPRDSRLYPLFRSGWIGVELFFVLSGFLITTVLLKERGQPSYYRRFYWRRFLRIFPLYYAVLAVLVSMAVVLRGAGYLGEMRAQWGSPAWFALFAGNLPTAWHGAWPPDGPFVPMWSLQIEEQFYLVYPAIVALWPARLRTVLWSGVVVSLVARCLVWWVWPANVYAPYVLTICRMDSLAFGGLLALARRDGAVRIQGRWIAAGAVAIAGAAAWLGDAWQDSFAHTLGITMLAVWFAGCLGWALQNQDSARTALLRWRPLVYLGTISYGVYLLHMVVLFVFEELDVPVTLAVFPVLVGLSLGAGAASWHLFESPILRWGHSRPSRTGRAIDVAVVVES